MVMKNNSSRRGFLKMSGLIGLSVISKPVLFGKQVEQAKYETYLDEIEKASLKEYKPIFNMSGYRAPKLDNVRIGFIGVGKRGTAAVQRVSQIEGVVVRGICDIREESAVNAKAKIAGNNAVDVKLYYGKQDSWKELCDREDVDLIYICTDWHLHTDIAVYAMEKGKHVAVEVPAARTIDECWRLVTTSEKTKRHCVMLENCCYDFFELLTLNMARNDFFGEIIHCEGAYIHDLLDSLFDKNARYDYWRLRENAVHNGNLYPTHGIGPISQILKINRGNKMEYMTAMASKDFLLGKKNQEMALNDPFFKQFNGKKFRGNINSSNIMTASGSTILLQHDVSSPRPYSRLHVVSGTKAFAQKYPLPAKIATGHEGFIDDQTFKALEEKYTPGIVKKIGDMAKLVGGHGGMDYIMDWRLIDCLRNGLPVDMDVYDAASWSVIGPLSEWSIANGSQPIKVPDFTMGRWKNNNVHDINLES